MKRLNQLGARKIVVADVGPLGCIPYVRALEFIPAGECSAFANQLTQGYNKKLKRMIYKLNQEMGPESRFVYANTYEIVMEIIQQYRQYGELSSLLQLPLAKTTCECCAAVCRALENAEYFSLAFVFRF
jgi:phospholipase/lecithinase/hemolysin